MLFGAPHQFGRFAAPSPPLPARATYRCDMSSILLQLRPWLEPAVGAVFFAMWCIAEAGRYQGGTAIVALAAISAAIAVSRVLPVVALAAVASVILLQVFQVLRPPESTTWPVLFGVLLVVFVVAFEASRRVAISALVLGLPLALCPGYLVGLGLNSWVGPGSGRSMADVFVSVAVIVRAHVLRRCRQYSTSP